MDKVKLKLDWATHASAKYACENWHYSKRIPVNKLVKIGVWENDDFKGVIIFGVGASATAHIQYRLKREELCELVRVALKRHSTEVSRLIKIAISMMKKENPKLKLISSFADTYQNHHGGIYQAGNWVYAGLSAKVREYFFNGKWRHATDVYKRLNSEQIKKLPIQEKPGKHKYLMPLNKEMHDKIKHLSKPYPKRIKHKSNAPRHPLGEGGAVPTYPLHGIIA